MKRRYSWKPDLPDPRDHILPITSGRPSSVDLRAQCSPVEDQGNLGSCTANAWAGMLEFLEIKAGSAFVDKSRLFIYYEERVLERTTKHDDGAQIRDGAKALHRVGCCAESIWPYKISKFANRPPRAAYKDAGQNKITEYFRCLTLDDCLNSLAGGYPVVFGFTVFDAFESDQVAQTGVLNMPAQGEQMLGGHAVLMVGYDDAAQRVLVRNSWGASWGQAGYFTMPYKYVSDRNLSDDFWTVRK